jgi:hypothetical protein
MSMNPSNPSSRCKRNSSSASAGEPRDDNDQSFSSACREVIRESLASEVGEAQRAQVQVKWKPDWRWCWRVERGSSGDVSVVC